MAQSDEQMRIIVREVLLENLDKIASAVASKLKVKLKDRSTFIRKEQRLEFVKRYSALCALTYTENNHVWLRDAKTPQGKAVVELARQELKYKNTTYSGDIYRKIGITYLKSVGKWKY